MDVRRMRNEALGKRVVKALESRNMEAYYASTKEEAVQKALELMEEGSSVTMGGSMSVRDFLMRSMREIMSFMTGIRRRHPKNVRRLH